MVFCYPMGHEYLESHRAFRQLAGRLSGTGFPVLRFDYYGCGDSAGASSEWTLARWTKDIGVAVDEIRRRTGARKILLVGLRLGASLALQLAARRTEIESVVLWDPVVNGSEYLEALRRLHRERAGSNSVRQGVNGTEILGFVLPDTLLRELEGLDLLNVAPGSLLRALTIATRNDESEAVGALGERLQIRGVRSDYRCIPTPRFWRDDTDRILVPADVIDLISDWICDG